MSASWDPPGVTHDLLEYLKAESIREEGVWGGVRNRSEAQNGVSEPPTHLLMPAGQVILVATCRRRCSHYSARLDAHLPEANAVMVSGGERSDQVEQAVPTH